MALTNLVRRAKIIKTKHLNKKLYFSPDNLCILLVTMGFALGLCLANMKSLNKYYFYLQNAELCLGCGLNIHFIPLKQAINDILMGLVFFLVGLEIKNSYRLGELSNYRELTTAFFSGLFGIGIALILFFLICGDPNYANISTAGLETDTMIVLFVLRLFGHNMPKSIYGFICLIAILDDLIGMLLFNYFHASHIDYHWLSCGLMALLFVCALNFIECRAKAIFIVAIALAWICFELSNLHGTLPAFIAGLLIPSKPKISYKKLQREINKLPDILLAKIANLSQLEANRDHAINKLITLQQNASTPSFSFKNHLDAMMAYALLPFFIFINAGMPINKQVILDCMTKSFAWALFLALFIGKGLGISLGAWVAIKLNIGELPRNVSFSLFRKVASLFGIGFTFSFFIVESFISQLNDIYAAKFAILLASIASLLIGIIAIKKNIGSSLSLEPLSPA